MTETSDYATLTHDGIDRRSGLPVLWATIDTGEFLAARGTTDDEGAKHLQELYDRYYALRVAKSYYGSVNDFDVINDFLKSRHVDSTGLYGDGGDACAYFTCNVENSLDSDIGVYLFSWDGAPYALVVDSDAYGRAYGVTIYADTTMEQADWYDIDRYGIYCVDCGEGVTHEGYDSWVTRGGEFVRTEESGFHAELSWDDVEREFYHRHSDTLVTVDADEEQHVINGHALQAGQY